MASVGEERMKLFQCNLCDASFTRKASLKDHITAIHEGQKPFQCNKCGVSFAQTSTLNRHVASVHEKRSFTNAMFVILAFQPILS